MNVNRIIEAAKHSTSNAGVISRLENMQCAPGYAEPGYDDPAGGVYFANWNDIGNDKTMGRVADLIEKAGGQIEWEDEWYTCDVCGKAFRTSPDSYGWTPSYVVLHDCEFVCLDCVDREEYLESIQDNPKACSFFNPTECGYIRIDGEWETGFHPGQNDKPAEVLKKLHAAGHKRVVFYMAGKGQFDCTWQAYKPAA